MNIPKYPKQLHQLLNKKSEANEPYDIEEPVVREMRRQDSIENNTDPNDMPLEIAKNLDSNLGPIDTEAEAKAINQEKEKQTDNGYKSPYPKP